MSDLVLRQNLEEKKELIKKTVANKASDTELEMFLHLANKYNLDPFAKEIWFIKYNDNDKPQIYTSRDGYLKIAHASGVFDGMDSYTIDDDKGNPVKAVCKVYRKDMSRPFAAEIKVNEYFQQNSSTWKKYPSAMAIKVAEVAALKRAFSITGLVTREEIEENTNVEHKPYLGAKPVAIEDVEDWNKEPEAKKITSAQRKRLFALAKAEKNTEGLGYPLPRWEDAQLKDLLETVWGYTSSKDILMQDYEAICKFVEEHAGQYFDTKNQVKIEVE